MNYLEMKNNVLALIGGLTPDSEADISAKFSKAVNHVMTELARIKRVSDYVKVAVNKGNSIEFADEHSGEVYQIKRKDNGKHIVRADGTYEISDEDTAEIDSVTRPKRITPRRANEKYTFGLGADLLLIMPYGILANLLEGEIGAKFAAIYDSMLQRLDPRH